MCENGQVPHEERRLRVAASSATPASAYRRPRPNLVPAQAAAAYDVVARREALPVNTPTSVLEACRSVVAATLFYGTDLYHYVSKKQGKYSGRINVRGIQTYTPFVASAELFPR